MINVSSNVEDYLKTIYAHTEWQNTPMNSTQLASRLKVANSSVSEMIQKLKKAGLVDHEPYGKVHLTDTGRARALTIVRRHRLLETFLAAELQYSWDEVHDEAELLEHVVSDTFIERVAQKLGHPRTDPHGDPIPQTDGSIVVPPSLPVGQVEVGGSGVVVRISDTDSDVLRALQATQVGLGTRITVLKTQGSPEHDPENSGENPACLTLEVRKAGDGKPSSPRGAVESEGEPEKSEPEGSVSIQHLTPAMAAALWVTVSEDSAEPQ